MTYFVQINGSISLEELELLQTGVVLDDGYRTKPAIARILRTGDISHVELVIYEGKFHQVKRMFEALQMEVTFLERVRFKNLLLDRNLELGEFRKLTDEELEGLRNEDSKN